MSHSHDLSRLALILLATVQAKLVDASTTATATATNGAPAVVLTGGLKDKSFIDRLAAEVQALGIPTAVRLFAVTDPPPEQQVELAFAAGTHAFVRVESGSGRIEVFIADQTTHGVAVKEVLESASSAAAESVLTVRAAEFVRAMLLAALSRDAFPSSRATRLVPGRVAASSPGSPSFGIAVASGVAVAAGGLGAQVELGVHLRVYGAGVWGVEFVGLAPVTSEPIPGIATTNARAAVWLAGGGALARIGFGSRALAEIAAGGLAVALRVSGNPGVGWVGDSEVRLGGAAYGRAGGALRISRILALRADLLLGAAFRRPVASAGGPANYPWGPAFALALGGVEIRWF